MQLRSPNTVEEFRDYFCLRWEVLRAPWGQAKGSEQDEYESQAYHIMLCTEQQRVIGVGRLHFNSPQEAQIRYMAVHESYRQQGIGSRILHALESQAHAQCAERIHLSARTTASKFYLAHGYETLGNGHTLFASIPHLQMEKRLTLAAEVP